MKSGEKRQTHNSGILDILRTCSLTSWLRRREVIQVSSSLSCIFVRIILLWDDGNACDWIKETPEDYLRPSEANGRRLDMNDLENNTTHKLLLSLCSPLSSICEPLLSETEGCCRKVLQFSYLYLAVNYHLFSPFLATVPPTNQLKLF